MIEKKWAALQSDHDFAVYIQKTRQFDPVGFDRAMKTDVRDGVWEFRRAVIEAFEEDLADLMPTRPLPA